MRQSQLGKEFPELASKDFTAKSCVLLIEHKYPPSYFFSGQGQVAPQDQERGLVRNQNQKKKKNKGGGQVFVLQEQNTRLSRFSSIFIGNLVKMFPYLLQIVFLLIHDSSFIKLEKHIFIYKSYSKEEQFDPNDFFPPNYNLLDTFSLCCVTNLSIV